MTIEKVRLLGTHEPINIEKTGRSPGTRLVYTLAILVWELPWVCLPPDSYLLPISLIKPNGCIS